MSAFLTPLQGDSLEQDWQQGVRSEQKNAKHFSILPVSPQHLQKSGIARPLVDSRFVTCFTKS
ncbi:MAG: hypothetical protein Q4A60_08220 [Pasteurellaceae bacterium]|nr:hypothetical protein [Pasteurellaceae bacterium]